MAALEAFEGSSQSSQMNRSLNDLAYKVHNSVSIELEAELDAIKKIAIAKEKAIKEEQDKKQKALTESMEKALKAGQLISEKQLEDYIAIRKKESDLSFAEAKKNALAEAKEKIKASGLTGQAAADALKEERKKINAQQAEQKKAALKEIEAEGKAKLENGKKLIAQDQERQKKTEEWNKKQDKLQKGKAANKEAAGQLTSAFTEKGLSMSERLNKLSAATHNDKGEFDLAKTLGAVTTAMSDFVKQLDSQIESIARKQSSIDTRLQGSKNETISGSLGGGSYWNKISKDIAKAAAISPLVKQEDIVSNVESMVETGISYNVEQRAFLASISKKIATTFNAADSSLLKLVRLQQKDSTAARLGMESTMNAFLNNMYENTEYLKGVAESVRSNLLEAESLMSETGAVEFEYQMQKWLGSLYSVGMDRGVVTNIASAVGGLASGKISSVTGGGISNLLLMAANNANISIADALADGLDASETNVLMQAMVNYLASIYDESKGSKVLQQQFANVYGVSASDLKAAVNLANDNGQTIKAITNNNLTYQGALTQLTNMANTMYQRTSIGELMDNASANLQYGIASNIASSPALYATYKVANMLSDVAGGIEFSLPLVLGSGTAQTFNVADIMRSGILAGSLFKGLGNIMSTGGGITGSSLLKSFGVGSTASVARGTGTNLITSGATVSDSGYIGNSSGSDVQNKTMTDTTDSANQKVSAAKDEESSDVPNKTINENVVKIYALLNSVVSGTSSFSVKMDTYGLSWN